MHSGRSNPSGEDEHQENEESANEETIDQLELLSNDDEKQTQLTKRKRRKMETDPKRLRLLREKALKRPIFEWASDSNLETAPSTALFFDGGSQSDSDQERAAIFELLPKLAEIRQEEASDLPYEFKKAMNFMGGSSPKFVVEKKLSRADVDERHNRLSIPLRKIRTNFLELEEEERLNEEKWQTVEMIEPDASVSPVTLSKWETRKGPAYVMITEWKDVVERNELQEGAKVRLWSFRAGGHGRLCFALVKVDEEEEEENKQFFYMEKTKYDEENNQISTFHQLLKRV